MTSITLRTVQFACTLMLLYSCSDTNTSDLNTGAVPDVGAQQDARQTADADVQPESDAGSQDASEEDAGEVPDQELMADAALLVQAGLCVTDIDTQDSCATITPAYPINLTPGSAYEFGVEILNSGERSLTLNSLKWAFEDDPVNSDFFTWAFDNDGDELPTSVPVGESIVLNLAIEPGLEPGRFPVDQFILGFTDSQSQPYQLALDLNGSVATCVATFGNCDRDWTTGCETELNTDAVHCGACNSACSVDNGTTSCSAGACVPVCTMGWQGETCAVNIDECDADEPPCHSDATCTDTPGSFTCVCNPGFEPNGDTCVDIIECLINNGDCDVNATCTNTAGSRLCECNAGYTGDGVGCFAPPCSDDSPSCNDPNFTCHTDGAIGADNTLYACVPSRDYTTDDSCPSGYFEVANDDDSFSCVPASQEACNGIDQAEVCSYTWENQSVEGVCWDGVCRQPCFRGSLHPFGGDWLETIPCDNANSFCTLSFLDGFPDYNACVESPVYTNAQDCPSGTRIVVDSEFQLSCVPGSIRGCGLVNEDGEWTESPAEDGSECRYSYEGVEIEGGCVTGLCLETCQSDSTGCSNPNSQCISSGPIGAPDTAYGCFPTTFDTMFESCPYGAATVPQEGGTTICLMPSATACAEAIDGADCAYTWNDLEISGSCLKGECISGCNATGEGCTADNTRCHALGVIGAEDTNYVCVHEERFLAPDDCPAGTYTVQRTTNSRYACAYPNATACEGQNDDTACTFAWDDISYAGTCHNGACTPNCDPSNGTCANPNSACHATATIGVNEPVYVCIEPVVHEQDSACPSGTHEIVQANGTYQCVPPSNSACAGAADLDRCSFTWGSNDISGTCYQNACREGCSTASFNLNTGGVVPGTPCANSNSTCQATGVIGAASTSGVCIPGNTFTTASECPSGTHAIDQGDGTVDCIPPSGIECNGADAADNGQLDLSNLGTACSYEHDGNTVSGACFGFAPGGLACVDVCMPATLNGDGSQSSTMCANSNSTCQALGVIGAPATIGVCIPGNTFTTTSQCPSGTHAVDQGDGTVDCIPPSGIECNGADAADNGQFDLSNLGTACSYEHDGNTVSGACFGFAPGELACVDVCMPATLNGDGSQSSTMCANSNSTCQALGVIGAPATIGVCIPGNTFTTTSQCPSGTHAVDQGDDTVDCIPPSGIECNGADAADNGQFDLSNLGSACSFSHDGNTVSGVCFGTAVGDQACIATCGSAGMNNFYTPGSRETCTNPNSVCQPSGAVGDPSTLGLCVPSTSTCVAAFGSEDAACPTGSFSCNPDGQCIVPSVISCVTAVDGSGNPTAFAATGTQCVVDGDLDGTNDADEMGYCVSTGVGSATVCLPDCSDGTCDASSGTGTSYCQVLEADGTGVLLDLLDNGAADGSAGHPRPNDIAACIPVSSTCTQDSDCPAATSVGCDTAKGVCLTPSLTACSAGGLPGQATQGTACDANGNGTANDGICITNSGVQVCLAQCTPDGSTAANCNEASAQCTTVGSGLSVCTGL